jgi:hypothetical protein
MCCKVFVRGLLVVVAAMAMARLANADLTKDSADFGYKYEMNALPPASELPIYNGDGLSGHGTASVGFDSSIGSNVLTFAAGTSGSDPLIEGDEAGKLWAANYSVDNGFTIEARVKIAAGVNTKPLLIDAGLTPYNPSDPNLGGNGAALNINATGELWGSHSGAGLGQYATLGPGTEDNSSAYHVFRIVQLAGSNSWKVWRDGTLVGDSTILAPGDHSSSDPAPMRFYYGDSGGDHSGTSYTDYLRFDFTGAYDPVPTPEPSGITLLALALIGLLAYAWRKRK